MPQQAASAGHKSRFGAVKLAFSTAQRTRGGAIQSRRSAIRMVRAMSNGVGNRLRRAQPIGPGRSATGGAMLKDSVATSQRSTSAMRALYQFMKTEVSRLKIR